MDNFEQFVVSQTATHDQMMAAWVAWYRKLISNANGSKVVEQLLERTRTFKVSSDPFDQEVGKLAVMMLMTLSQKVGEYMLDESIT